ncbi:hypothetical protein ACFFX0_00840 [Citricoccus parietis]|uniref:Uncharacterized protein n=1 Tax=Citricoccus parietis TaxID=592307 RepID=A0ABV5FT10_9MICC
MRATSPSRSPGSPTGSRPLWRVWRVGRVSGRSAARRARCAQALINASGPSVGWPP